MTQEINDQLTQALKNKNSLRVGVLRLLKSALDNEAIALKKKKEGLNEGEAVKVLKREANKRRDAMAAYHQGGRLELAEKEQSELAIIEEFLPAQLSEGQIGQIVADVISEVKPSGSQDFGRVMGQVMKKVGAQADGSRVSKIVKEKLGIDITS